LLYNALYTLCFVNLTYQHSWAIRISDIFFTNENVTTNILIPEYVILRKWVNWDNICHVSHWKGSFFSFFRQCINYESICWLNKNTLIFINRLINKPRVIFIKNYVPYMSLYNLYSYIQINWYHSYFQFLIFSLLRIKHNMQLV